MLAVRRKAGIMVGNEKSGGDRVRQLERIAASGGRARKKALSPEERSEIARQGAEAKWAKRRGLPKETHTGTLKLGDGIPCSVLAGGMRVLSVNGVTRAFNSGGKGRVAVGGVGTEMVPSFLAAANVRPFISTELAEQLRAPIAYRSMTGGRTAIGYEADILRLMCDSLLEARAAGVLRAHQMPTASAAEILMRGFAKVGIIALVDEATGYQADRAHEELQLVLRAYISKELLKWTERFPPEFFEQVFRIHGWPYVEGSAKRPGYVGKFINKFVYEQLPDGVLDHLRAKNPRVNGHRKTQHHRWLTNHTGNPHLDKQVVAVITAMKLSKGKTEFVESFNKLYAPRGTQVTIDFPESDELSLSVAPVVGGVAIEDVVGSASARVLAALAGGNTVGSGDLAMQVYGDRNGSTLNKLRAVLNRLKAEGLVESTSKGIWKRSPRSPA
jgi:hypothetical protein